MQILNHIKFSPLNAFKAKRRYKRKLPLPQNLSISFFHVTLRSWRFCEATFISDQYFLWEKAKVIFYANIDIEWPFSPFTHLFLSSYSLSISFCVRYPSGEGFMYTDSISHWWWWRWCWMAYTMMMISNVTKNVVILLVTLGMIINDAAFWY